MKAVIGTAATSILTSSGLRDAKRRVNALKRRLRGTKAQVHYFHQADDPYAHLMLQVLPVLAARYDVSLEVHLASAPSDAAAPDRERLEGWSRRDAQALAQALGLHYADPGRQPSADAVDLANRALATIFGLGSTASSERLDTVAMLAQACAAGDALWRDNRTTLATLPLATHAAAQTAMQSGAVLRQKLGHYLGATLYFEGEWYWGIDRLSHLERRLRGAGLTRAAPKGWIALVPAVACDHIPTNGGRPNLDFFLSFRSPYTYLSLPRVRRLAAHYGANLRLRFVLPMIMRGMPVPREKRLYMVLDTKREADALGMRFGRCADPVGAPTERGLSVLNRAIPAGKGPEFAESFLQGVFADGIDAGSDAGLFKIAARVGLDQEFVLAALADPSWRATAESNRTEMLRLGVWGVPSLRVDDGPIYWGQDRLWLVERDLIAATAARRDGSTSQPGLARHGPPDISSHRSS